MADARGFTLLELSVGLALLMLISGLVAGSFAPWLTFQQRLETDQRLTQLAPLWLDFLARHADEIEADTSRPGMPVGGGWLADGTLLAADRWATRLTPILRFSGRELFEDGFHQPWRLHVSRGLVREEAAVPVHYHVLALLSAGANGQFEGGTSFDPDTGALILAGDDRGVLIDGWPGAQQRLHLLEDRLERAAQAWQSWFHSRWEGDAERDASIDYFSAACPGDPLADAWDAAPDALQVACNAADDPAAAGARLGLAPADLHDAAGQALRFDSHSVATRNPDHPDPGQRMPPYSAIVSGTLPGDVRVQRAALGAL